MFEAATFVLSVLFLLGFVSWGTIWTLLEILAVLGVGLILLRAVHTAVKKQKPTESIIGLNIGSALTQ